MMYLKLMVITPPPPQHTKAFIFYQVFQIRFCDCVIKAVMASSWERVKLISF